MDLLETLQANRSGNLLVVTGAGVSLASGIPTFRGTDPGAVWANDVLAKGTKAFFERDPKASWLWYLERFGKVLGAQPNAAHHALVTLEQVWEGDFLLVTQNIDGLHRKAGSNCLVEVHGSAQKVRCSRRGCINGEPKGSISIYDPHRFVAAYGEPDYLRALKTEGTLPRCERCNKILRPHILWFDEYYSAHEDYQIERVKSAANNANVILFVGTSFSVGVTEDLVDRAGLLGTPAFAVDPGSVKLPQWIQHVPAQAEVLLPDLVASLTKP
jgi:NAD-dependent deacetylase